MKQPQGAAKRLTELALLTALALILFLIELRIPNLSPVPGVKLGLANIVTVFAVFRYAPHETVMLVTARILLGGLFGGNPSALILSGCGGIFCLCGMLLLRKVLSGQQIWLCSVIGGMLHNIGQTVAAVAVMRTFAVFSYLPLLLISGAVAGAFTGICAQLLLKRFS